MLNRGLKFFFVLLAVTLVLVVIIISKQSSTKQIHPLLVFDDSTEVVVRINNPHNFFYNVEEQPSCSLFKQFFSDTTELQGIIPASFFEMSSQIFLAYHPSDGFTIVLAFDNEHNSTKWTNNYKKNIAKTFKINEKKEYGNTVYTLTDLKNKTYGLSDCSGLVIVNQSFEGCCRIVRKVALKSVENATNKMISVEKYASINADANIFVNLQSDIETFPYLSDKGISVFDTWIKDQTILVNGLSSGHEPKEYMNVIKNRNSVDSDIEKVVPSIAKSFYHLAVDKPIPLFSEIDKQYNQSFQKSFGISINELIERIFANEIVKFSLNNEKTVVGLKIKGTSVTEHNLKNMIETASRQMLEATEHKHVFDKETKFSIFQAKWGDITGSAFGRAFSEKNAKYMTIVSEYLYISSDIDALKNLISALVLQQTMSASIDYQPIKMQKASKSNITIYQQQGSKTDMLSFWLSEKLHKSINERLSSFPYKMLWQVSYDMEKPYHNIVIDFGKHKTAAAKSYEWKSRLENSSILKPTIVSLGQSNASGILVQDSSNILYLLNRQGRVLWQKQLDGIILSDINQVVKDNKRQLLFNTSNTLYLTNMDGDDSDRYPISFKSKATTGLALFDYDSNKNYRIAIPHEDRTISMIDIDGNKVDGWNFSTTDAIVTTPAQHFCIGTKDYILLGDTLRVYILDRRGDQRIKPSELYGKAQNSPFFYSSSRSRWFTTTNSGELMSISLDGTVRREKLFDLSQKHFYIYADFTSDGKGNHIFVDKNRLLVTNNQGKQVFTHIFKGEIQDMPTIYRFSAKKRGIGVVDRTDKKVFLFDQNGKQLLGFPTHGITPFTITRYENENNFHLLVGHIDGFIYDIKIE